MEPAGEATQAGGGGFWSLVRDVWGVGVFGVDLGRILVAAAILLLCIGLRRVLGDWLREQVDRLARRSDTLLDDRLGEALEKPLAFLPVVIGVFLAGRYLGLSGGGAALVDSLSRSLVAFTIFWALTRLIDPLALSLSWLDAYVAPELAQWLWKAARGLLWVIGGATILEIWGVNVAGIIAGFGLLGVAVALGAQDMFKNLISGVLILTEKRLRVGDWVMVEGLVEGTVETIGFRSTKIRRFDKAPVYVPNKEFADGAVVNFGEMTNRRISWKIGLEYRTSAAQLAAIRERIEAAIREDDRFMQPPDAALFVRLDEFAASSIDLLIYCFTKTRDWGEWLAIKEELLMTVKRIVEEEGAGFAFPSRSLYIESASGGSGGAAVRPADGAGSAGAGGPRAQQAAPRDPAVKREPVDKRGPAGKRAPADKHASADKRGSSRRTGAAAPTSRKSNGSSRASAPAE